MRRKCQYVTLLTVLATLPASGQETDPAMFGRESSKPAKANSGLVLPGKASANAKKTPKNAESDRQTPPPEDAVIPHNEPKPLVVSRDMAVQSTADVPWYRSGLASLGIVLAVLGLAATVAKRYLKSSAMSGGEVLKVLSRAPIAPKQSIALVQLGGRLAFVGITGDSISLLRIVEDAEEAAKLRGRLNASGRRSAPSDFEDQLKGATSRFGEESESKQGSIRLASAREPNLRGDVRQLLNRLKSMDQQRSARWSRGESQARSA